MYVNEFVCVFVFKKENGLVIGCNGAAFQPFAVDTLRPPDFTAFCVKMLQHEEMQVLPVKGKLLN